MRNVDHQQPLAVLVTRNFPPLLGGMEKLNWHVLDALQPAWRVALCGPAGCEAYAPSKAEVRAGRIRPLPLFLLMTLVRTVGLAMRRKPEWIIAGSGVMAPIAWLAARCTGAKVAVYVHGLDIVVPSRIYRWLWLPFIRHSNIVLANSALTKRLAQGKGVDSDRLHILHPGTDLPVLNSTAATDFRKRHDLGGRPLLLTVGRLTQRKGLAEFISRAMPAILAEFPEAILVVIGDEAGNALKAQRGSERTRIEMAVRRVGVESNVRFLGRCDDAALSAAYQACDVHVFPVLALRGDVEGFGMVALESAAHGLPTVAFDVGGVADAVSHGVTGELVAEGRYDCFANAVTRQFKRAHSAEATAACREFAKAKAWPLFGERLRDLLTLQDSQNGDA